MSDNSESPFEDQSENEDEGFQEPDLTDDIDAVIGGNDQSFYAILNVPKDANVNDIKERYHALAIMFHPDKAQGIKNKATAEARFRDIRRAYEVLIDPEARKLYDMLGEEGLKQQWEVGQVLKSPEQIREAFKRAKRKERTRFADSVFGRANVSTRCMVDARPLLDFRNDYYLASWKDRFEAVHIRQLKLASNVRSQINATTGLQLNMSAGGMNGRGQHAFLGTVWHQYSPRLTFEATSSIISPRILVFKGRYVVDPLTVINVVTQTAFQFLPPFIPPALAISVQRRLHPSTSGTITYATGSRALGIPSSFALELSSSQSRSSASPGRKSSTNGTLVMGPDFAVISYFYSRPVGGRGLTASIGGNLSLAGLALFVRWEVVLAQSLKFSWTTSTNAASLTFELGIQRPDQKFFLPIQIASVFTLGDMGIAIAVPAVSLYLLDAWISRRRRSGDKQSRIAAFKKQNAELLQQRKLDAEEVTELLREQVLKKVDAETKKAGLVVVEALYGAMDRVSGSAKHSRRDGEGDAGDEDRWLVNVTIAVQALVSGESQLTIPGGRSKSVLLGFYDPCVGEPKKLKVRYVYRGKLHEVMVDDDALLLAPQRSHALE